MIPRVYQGTREGTREGIPPERILAVGHDGGLQRDERWCLLRIVSLQRNNTFRHQRPLRVSIRSEQTGWSLRLTGHRELALFGAPILLEKPLKVSDCGALSFLRQL
jgi:hypothetical protein